MELQQLACVAAIADERNFTRAAARLGVAQPGVSAQIRRLEEELGEQLFDRSGRAVALTAAGEALLPHAWAALAAVERAKQSVEQLRGLVYGHVNVGMLPSSSFHDVDLPSLLARFRDRYPGVSISLSESRADRLIDEVARGGIDFAFAAIAGTMPEGIDGIVLRDESLCAGVARTGPWAGASEIAIGELRGETLICLPKGSGMRALLDRACEKGGFVAPVSLEASDPSVVAQLASRGLGIAILPVSIVEAFPRALCPVPITGAELRGQMVLAWRAEGPKSPAARTLIAMAKEMFAGAESPP
jgi:DNA-binding transcriptional LysR family regulator